MVILYFYSRPLASKCTKRKYCHVRIAQHIVLCQRKNNFHAHQRSNKRKRHVLNFNLHVLVKKIVSTWILQQHEELNWFTIPFIITRRSRLLAAGTTDCHCCGCFQHWLLGVINDTTRWRFYHKLHIFISRRLLNQAMISEVAKDSRQHYVEFTLRAPAVYFLLSFNWLN